jgi:deoxyinosine 3'endonuclease (endonuclease V)
MVDDIKLIGGVDISFQKEDPDQCCAFLTIMDFKTLEIVWEAHLLVRLTLPYESGFLAFREVPHYLTLLERLRTERPEFIPQVILVDGFGILHVRGCGSASQLGVLSGIPTIGVGKTLVAIDELEERKVRKEVELAKSVGLDTLPLVGSSGIVHGMAVAFHSRRPIYISIGTGVSLETAVDIVKRVSLFRVPEPIRRADLESKKYL